MANRPQMGYMGLADIGGTRTRCSSFSINPKQDPSFYDHTIGLSDTIPSNDATKGESVGTRNIQKTIWRPSVISVSGGISYPCTEKNISGPFNLAKYANYFSTYYTYYCEYGRSFPVCRMNSFEFSVQAGDVAQVNLDVLASSLTDGSVDTYVDSEKLITWDNMVITGDYFEPENLVGFRFKINNNLMPIYTNASLFPSDIRVGMQHITGSISVYLHEGEEFITDADYSNIGVSCKNFSTSLKVVYSANQMDGIVGPVVTEIPFVGVDMVF